jgi:hypothetical protein
VTGLLARSVHDLQLDAVGVIEEERVVTRHVVVLPRRRLDRDALLPCPRVALVDDVACRSLESDVVDADAVAVVFAADPRLAHADRRSSARQVGHGLATLADDVSDARIPEWFEELTVERKAPLE